MNLDQCYVTCSNAITSRLEECAVKEEGDSMNHVYHVVLINREEKCVIDEWVVVAKNPEEAKWVKADMKAVLDSNGIPPDNAHIICREIGAFEDVKS